MACFWFHQQETSAEVASTEEINSIIYYKILVKVANVEWSVLHRYSEFDQLHNQLVCDHGVSKHILPPKKIVWNKTPMFIETRRKALDEYLKYILKYLTRTMPRIFIEFLNFHYYDVFFLLQTLASQFYFEAEKILTTSKCHAFNPLELHAISECFKTPFPEIEQSEGCYDISHVLDFISQLNKLSIQGRPSTHLTSNILMNDLPVEFTSFKALECLEIIKYDLKHVNTLGVLRNTLKKLIVHYTNITSISQILQCDVIHKSSLETNQIWTLVTEIDLSSNQLTEIDETIKLVPNLETLILNDNKIKSIANLSSLPKLKHLYLCNNLISNCDQLHTKLGNLLTLNLSQNLITSIQGFSKLYSLETMILSSNRIKHIDDISCIGSLPCLENLELTGNPVSTKVDYRVKILEIFAERAHDMCLDNERPSQAELDKVSVLRALRIVKEGRTPDLADSSFS